MPVLSAELSQGHPKRRSSTEISNTCTCSTNHEISHFRVALNLIMKARLSSKFSSQKCAFIHKFSQHV